MSELIFGIDNTVLAFFVVFIICILGLLAYSVKGSPSVSASRPSGADVRGPQPPPRISTEHCPICLEAIRSEVQANCGHVYCAKCISDLWTSKNYAQLDCPYCRRIVTINYEDGERPERQVEENIKQYNRRYSGRPRPFMERVKDFPTLIRQLFARLFQMNTVFVLRAVLMLIGLVVYVLSPFDIIPESVFGVIGLIDDLLLIVIVLFVLANTFYTAYSNRFQYREERAEEERRENAPIQH